MQNSFIFFELTKEYLYLLKRYFVSHIPPAKWLEGERGNVILVPGFMDDHVFLMPIADALNSAGYKIHILKDFDTTFQSIEDLAKELDDYVKNNNLENIILVAHSKGGLVSRYVMEHYPNENEKIIKVFTISTPHKGTIFGKAKKLHLYQMMPNSEMIRELNAQKNNLHKIVNIYPRVDNSIVPNKNLILDGAENHQIDIVGHTRILKTKKCINIILLSISKSMELNY